MSMVDPSEALQVYAKRDRSRFGDISGRTEHNSLPDTDTDTIRHVAHATTKLSMGESDVALCGLATRCHRSDFVQKLPSSNSLPAGCDVGDISASSSSLNHGGDAEHPRFESVRMNATRYSSDNEQPRSHSREFHIRLAVTNLTRERVTVQVPADMDLDYIRFREELKQKLTSKGDECIWRGLEAQDEPRV